MLGLLSACGDLRDGRRKGGREGERGGWMDGWGKRGKEEMATLPRYMAGGGTVRYLEAALPMK